MTINALSSESPALRVYTADLDIFKEQQIQDYFPIQKEKVALKSVEGISVIEMSKLYLQDSAKLPMQYNNLLDLEGGVTYDEYFFFQKESLFGNQEIEIELAPLSQIAKSKGVFFNLPFQRVLATKRYQEKGQELVKIERLGENDRDISKFDYVDVYTLNPNHDFIDYLNNAEIEYETWEDLNSDILSVLKIEKLFSSVVMFLIVCIGLFNLLAAISMLITIKRVDFAVLGILGMSYKDKQSISLTYGAIVICIGILIGLLLGIGFVILQSSFGFIPIDIQGAVVDSLPIRLDVIQLLIATLAVLFIGGAAIWIPTTQISKELTYR